MVFPGNFTFPPDPYKTAVQVITSADGGRYVWTYARAKLTDTLQTTIPLMVPSVKPNSLLATYPDIPLVIPVGAQIQRIDFRLPRLQVAGDEYQYGIDIPRGCTLIGTTGENLKVSSVATPHTVTAPLVTAASNLYTPNAGAVLQRQTSQADQSSPSLIQTVSTALTMQIAVSNAGNTAVGTGVRLSVTGAIAFIYASVVYRIDGVAVKPWNLDFPAMPG